MVEPKAIIQKVEEEERGGWCVHACMGVCLRVQEQARVGEGKGVGIKISSVIYSPSKQADWKVSWIKWLLLYTV